MITDHPFTPLYPGVEEWKQLCVHVDGDGEVCGRSRPFHGSACEYCGGVNCLSLHLDPADGARITGVTVVGTGGVIARGKRGDDGVWRVDMGTVGREDGT